MLNVKSIMQLKEVSGEEVTRGAIGFTSEDMAMVNAELKLGAIRFMHSLHKNYADKLDNNVFVLTYAVKGTEEEKEFSYRIAKKDYGYLLADPTVPGRGMKIEIKEEKEMKEEQIEFDLTVGTIADEIVVAEVAAPEKKSVLDAIAELKDVSQDTLKDVIARLSKSMKAKGVELSDKAAVAAYILANKEEVEAIHEEVANKAEELPELSGPAANEYMDAMRKLGVYTDATYVVMLNEFYKDGGDHHEFADAVHNKFDSEPEDIGNYFRDVMGVKRGHLGKRIAYTTGDAFRSTGNLVETGVIKTVQALNKYVFHMAAKIVEAPVGGRPDVLKDHNIVDDAASRAWNKINPSK